MPSERRSSTRAPPPQDIVATATPPRNPGDSDELTLALSRVRTLSRLAVAAADDTILDDEDRDTLLGMLEQQLAAIATAAGKP